MSTTQEPRASDFLARARAVGRGQAEMRLHPEDVLRLENLIAARHLSIFAGMRVVADSSVPLVRAGEAQ